MSYVSVLICFILVALMDFAGASSPFRFRTSAPVVTPVDSKPFRFRTSISNIQNNISEQVAVTKVKVENYFTARGVTDIKRAVLVHEVLGISMLFGTWTACYIYPPSQTKLLKEPISRMSKSLPSAMSSRFEFGKLGGSYIEAR